MPNTFEAEGCEYGTLERSPVDEDVEPREALLSGGFGACLGPSNPFDNEGFFFGGFVIRLALLTERFVSLQLLVLCDQGSLIGKLTPRCLQQSHIYIQFVVLYLDQSQYQMSSKLSEIYSQARQ
jgi:hypothetical protein